MTMTARAASTFVLMTSLLACSGVENAAGGSGTGGSSVIACSSDAQCSGGGCVQGKCIGRASLPPTWAAEIRPTTGSTAPTTEQIVLAMDPSSRFVELTADPRIDVRVTFNPPAGTPLPAPANVVLSVPSTIPGRPDRIFESGIAKDPLSNTVANVVTFEVPASVMMHSGTITLTPLSPADQQSPPFSFAIDSLGTDITLAIPTDSVWLRGILHNAVDQVPAHGFVARAYQNGRLVSSISLIAPGSDGSFRVAIPGAVASSPVTVEIAPQDVPPQDPWFTSDPWSPTNADMGTIKLPAYQIPQDFSVGVYGQGHQLIPNALVHVTTTLTPQLGGTARFSQDGYSNAMTGNAMLRLIPGTAMADRPYEVAVIPPAGTPFATLCTTTSVTSGGGTPVSLGELLPRPILSGNLVDASGVAVANAVVTATRDADTARVCSTTGLTTVSTRSNTSGVFTLALDAGTYQLDYDPQPGSVAPRLTENNVLINGNATRLVQLPQPNLVEGDVVDAEQRPLRGATVRLFEPRCTQISPCMSAPVLRMETQADMNGHFRAVVGMPSATN
jgi:hypothetical protein